MSGFSKISNTIIIVFVMSFMAFSCMTFFQIQQNIAEETSAALEQAREMLRVGVSASDMETVLAKSPHLSVSRFHGRLSHQVAQEQHYSEGLAQTVIYRSEPIVVPVSENQYMVISPHEKAELIQNLNFFWLVAALFLTTLGLLLFVIKSAIRERLKPLRELAVALQELAHGKHVPDLSLGDIEEVKQVITRFLGLQQSLEQKSQQLTKIDQKLAMLQEQERMYLAQELHDNVGQLLTTIKAHAYILSHATEPKVVEGSAAKVQSYSQRISDAIRQLTAHLHPLTLDKVSLQESLERLVFDQEQAVTNVDWQVSINLTKYAADRERDIHIYRFVQEAVNNVIKHANASKVIVDVYADNERLNVNIIDNGRGFKKDMTESIGLSSMRSRSRCIGGQCSVTSHPDKGVSVSLRAEFGETLTSMAPVAA